MLRPNIAAMQGYAYGEQPEDSQTIKLNTNENPYPPTPAVVRAMQQISPEALRRYPQPTARPLREALAELHGVTPEHILVTNGGDEGLRLALTTFVDPGESFAMMTPSYSLYEVLAQVQDARIVRMPMPSNWRHSEEIAENLRRENARLTCLVNPHAPSGVLTPSDTFDVLARQASGVLLIDQAYIDFVDPELDADLISLTEHHNVLLLRTFSKGYSLAGLRLGYLIGHPQIIEPIMSKTRDSYNVDHISQALGLAAISDQAYAQKTWAAIRTERARVRAELAKLHISCPDSQTNFLLADLSATQASAETIYEQLKQHGVLVRYFSIEPVATSLRISIGTPEENDRLLELLGGLL